MAENKKEVKKKRAQKSAHLRKAAGNGLLAAYRRSLWLSKEQFGRAYAPSSHSPSGARPSSCIGTNLASRAIEHKSLRKDIAWLNATIHFSAALALHRSRIV